MVMKGSVLYLPTIFLCTTGSIQLHLCGLTRHVVAYRRGFEPENFISHQHEKLLLKGSKGQMAGRKGGTTKDIDRNAPGEIDAIKIERVKRDRRSIEEVEEVRGEKTLALLRICTPPHSLSNLCTYVVFIEYQAKETRMTAIEEGLVSTFSCCYICNM